MLCLARKTPRLGALGALQISITLIVESTSFPVLSDRRKNERCTIVRLWDNAKVDLSSVPRTPLLALKLLRSTSRQETRHNFLVCTDIHDGRGVSTKTNLREMVFSMPSRLRYALPKSPVFVINRSHTVL